MVRYHEIIQESEEDNTHIAEILTEYFSLTNSKGKRIPWKDKVSFRVRGGKVDIIYGHECEVIKSCSEFPVQFNIAKITDFRCKNIGLTSLKGLPVILKSNKYIHIYCSNNNLTSLEHLPTCNIHSLACENNNLISLEGLNADTNVQNFRLTYQPDLPLLRLVFIKNYVEILDESSKTLEDLSSIFNGSFHETNLKKRILECQYAMIKAGYKGNAKW